jgi:hypothetical protein
MSIREDLLSVDQAESEDFIDLLTLQRGVDDDKDQLEQLLTVSDSLEALIKHIDSVSTMTPEHAESIRISCENLLHGTGYGYSALVPALEDYTSGTVSTESLKDRLSSVWKRIVSIILSILEGMKRYWSKVSSYQGRLMINAKNLQKLGAIKRGSSIRNRDVELGLEAKNLIVGGAVIRDPDTLIRAMAAISDQYKVVCNTYPKAMVSAGAVYEGLYKRGDDNVRQTLEDFCVASYNLPFGVLATQLRAASYRDPRFGPRQLMMAPPLLGGYSLFINVPDDPIKGLTGNDLATQAARIRTAGVRFSLTDLMANNINGASIATASGAQVEQLAGKVIDLLNLITTQESGRQIGRINNQIKAVLSAAEGYKARPHVGGEGTAVYSESILRFARSYSTWAVGPIDSMTTNMLSVSRAILIYGRKSLR